VTDAASTAALMDRIYGPQRQIYDATRKFYLLGRDTLIAGLAPAPDDRILEVGCGTGRNLIVAARQHPRAQFFGIDISREMLETAQSSVLNAGLGESIRFAQADASDLDPKSLFGIEGFQHVFFSYSLSMIPAWHRALDRAVAVLVPGGALHIVDFGNQADLPPWFKTALRAWLARFHVTPRDDLRRQLGYIAGRNATLWFQRPYRGYAQYAVLRLPR
jgi:S-adenosylmethionine-diacylgycerolhomoserine-N-methlytransferase